MSNDRMIVSLICEQCNAPLNEQSSECDYCRTPWRFEELYKRLENPSLSTAGSVYAPTGFYSASACYPANSVWCTTSGDSRPDPTPGVVEWR